MTTTMATLTVMMTKVNRDSWGYRHKCNQFLQSQKTGLQNYYAQHYEQHF